MHGRAFGTEVRPLGRVAGPPPARFGTFDSRDVLGGGTFMQTLPGSERALTLAEVQEVQKRLTAAGFDTEGTDGRVGNATMAAVANFQLKNGMPADGYAGLKVLAKLRTL